MPKTEYLPMGNQNFLFGFMLPPPGYNLDEVAEMQRCLRREAPAVVGSRAGLAGGPGAARRRGHELLLRGAQRPGLHGGPSPGAAPGAGADPRVHGAQRADPGHRSSSSTSRASSPAASTRAATSTSTSPVPISTSFSASVGRSSGGHAAHARGPGPAHPRSRPRQPRGAGGHRPPAGLGARPLQPRAGLRGERPGGRSQGQRLHPRGPRDRPPGHGRPTPLRTGPTCWTSSPSPPREASS